MARYYATSLTDVPYLPWPQIDECLELIPQWEYRENAHTAILGSLLTRMMGGQGISPQDILQPWANPEPNLGPYLIEDEAQEDDFRLALRRNLVSQHLLLHMSRPKV